MFLIKVFLDGLATSVSFTYHNKVSMSPACYNKAPFPDLVLSSLSQDLSKDFREVFDFVQEHCPTVLLFLVCVWVFPLKGKQVFGPRVQ